MDPNKALKELLDALRDQDREMADIHLGILWEWVRAGGFLPQDPRKPLLSTLASIKAGSEVTGRWLDENYTALEGTDPTMPPDGYMDGITYFETEHDTPGPEPKLAFWYPYDEDEQRAWLNSVARMADRAITQATETVSA